MSKDMAVVAFGVWIIILPYLGVPGSWRTAALVGTGILLVILGLSLRREALRHGGRHTAQHSFVENGAKDEPRPDVRYERKEGIHSLN